MNQHKNLPIKMGLLFGAALGVVVVSIGVIRYKSGMIFRGDQTLSYVYWGIFMLTILFAVFRFKKFDPLSFSYQQTIKIGLFAGLISGGMYTLYIVILNNYLDTDLASQLARLNEQELILEHPEWSTEEVAGSLNVMKMNSALRGFIYTLVCMTSGLIYSVIGTVLARRLVTPG